MTQRADPQSERIASLERMLEEATDTIDAIRNGEVDAIVVGGTTGQFVYTLENADRPYRVLVEQMKEGAVTLNEDGMILYANRSFCDLVGQKTGALIGSCLFDHVVDAGPLIVALSGGAPVTYEVSMVRTQGHCAYVNMSIVELQVEADSPRMFCSVVTDLSEMRKAEATLRQVQKMDIVGQLTGGVAHDFNNLLMAISSSLELLAKRVPFDPDTKRLIENAQQGASRGAALTQRMLGFARQQDLKPEQIDIEALAVGMRDLLQRTLGPAWSLELDFAENLSDVIADANQLEMAIMNLSVNARDAMVDGGPIQISAENMVLDVANDCGLPAGPYICLSVKDQGVGMDAETLSRAIEPFFTTKGIGKGTGLGLSMVHGLAKQLNGTFQLQSSPGRGSTATLWLPAVEANPVRAVAMSATSALRATPKLKILVADDEVLILMNVSVMLEDMGHCVLEASSGAEALKILDQHADIDLLITDHAMPGMTGGELIDHVNDRRPNLPIILATGYGDLPMNAPSRIAKLGKPFNQEQLADVLDAVMSRKADLAD